MMRVSEIAFYRLSVYGLDRMNAIRIIPKSIMQLYFIVDNLYDIIGLQTVSRVRFEDNGIKKSIKSL